MDNLLHIYDCPKCGKVLGDEVEHVPVQLADDEWGELPFCNKCHAEVKIRMHIDPETNQEIYHYEKVSDERARRANGFYDDFNTDEYFDN